MTRREVSEHVVGLSKVQRKQRKPGRKEIDIWTPKSTRYVRPCRLNCDRSGKKPARKFFRALVVDPTSRDIRKYPAVLDRCTFRGKFICPIEVPLIFATLIIFLFFFLPKLHYKNTFQTDFYLFITTFRETFRG